MRKLLFILILHVFSQAQSQTLGGNAVFNFLKLPATPQLTALGGVNVSVVSPDIGLAFNNPALLKEDMHTQVHASFNNFYAGINSYHLSFGYRHPKLETNFAWGLTYFDYGEVKQTDAAGNIMGDFRPRDWVMKLSASRKYLERWSYGASLGFIFSGYGQYKANGLALDAGVLYTDSANLLTVSVLGKNMGFMIKPYPGTEKEELPFDLQAGITKKLKDAPIAFSLTAQRIHQFDIRFNDTAFNNDIGLSNGSGKFTFDKLFRHFVFSTQIFPVEQVELSVGYNHLRRKELNIGNAGNGLNGFSLGVGLMIKKIQFRFATTHYQNNTTYQQIGINMNLNQYFGLGKFGEKIGW